MDLRVWIENNFRCYSDIFRARILELSVAETQILAIAARSASPKLRWTWKREFQNKVFEV